MAGFKTWVDNDVLTASDTNGYLMAQTVIQCTSATRPGSPHEGMRIWETDTDRAYYYSGAAWVILTEPRQTWTPTITQSTTVTGTVNRGWYRRENGLFEARLKWTSTGAGTAANPITVTTPVTMLDTNDVGGSWGFADATGPTNYGGYLWPNATGSAILVSDNSTGAFGFNPGVTIASGDVLYVTMFGTY